MSDENNNGKLPEAAMDFFRFIDSTIRQEEARRAVILPNATDKNEPYNPNREYYKRYGHHIADRMWIGKRRY